MTNTLVSVPAQAVAPHAGRANVSAESVREERLMKSMKTQYTADQQIKFLHLHAEAESLLQQLHAIKRQRELSDRRELVEACAR